MNDVTFTGVRSQIENTSMKFFYLLFVVFISLLSHGQVLKGKVVNDQGEGVPFARVGVINTAYGTLTNGEGKFILKLDTGYFQLYVRAAGYEEKLDSLFVGTGETLRNYTLEDEALELEEVVITEDSRKKRAMAFMRQVIDEKKQWEDKLSAYSMDMYVLSSLEMEVPDSLLYKQPSGRKKMNLNEFVARSYYETPNKYKDSVEAYLDLSDKNNAGGVSVSIQMDGNSGLAPQQFEMSNPYLFVQGSKDADVNLFKNAQNLPGVTTHNLVSPLSSLALLSYTYDIAELYYDENNEEIYVIEVLPRFKEAPLWSGKLYFHKESRKLLSVDLSLSKSVLNYFKEFHFICDYAFVQERIVPVRKEFIYSLKEGKKTFHGAIRIKQENYQFHPRSLNAKFWLTPSVMNDSAYDRDSMYWVHERPLPLKQEELVFIHEQDSILRYHQSEEYLMKRDSIFNDFSILNMIFNGVGHRNTFKKQSFYVIPLIQQVVPFGVGGYRHRLGVRYTQGTKTHKEFMINPLLDYGFRNKDLKWQFNGYYKYNSLNFAKIGFEVGDIYDFMTSYQSIQGTIAPANRVRNKKWSVYHFSELTNGLYLKASMEYSDRINISDIEYPEWSSLFGNFQQPNDFEGYRIFMTELYFEYHFQQRYKIRDGQKIILGSKWPVVSFKHKMGVPKLLGGQSNFSYVELKLEDEIDFKNFGETDVYALAGSFLYKQDLRAVEYKFFRTSDRYFFSNPVYSQQNLDTALSTANSYFQLNFIHHFKGVFLNKVPLINKLKLEETIGGSYMAIPSSNFQQVELYAGIERQFRIKKTIFKLGAYAVSSKSSYGPAQLNFKFGINFYNAFYKKWDY